MPNNLAFVISTLKRLESAGIQAWVFGGWAEEFWGLIPPRPHHDLDLLTLSADFQVVDSYLALSPELEEVQGKHFSHKRAFLCESVLVELILIQPKQDQFVTDFFSGRYIRVWPDNTLQFAVSNEGSLIPVASWQALQLHREQHPSVEKSYQAFLQG